MARDMNLMRQNVAKLVKIQGGSPSYKSDMFFKRSEERNSLFKSALSKMGGTTIEGKKSLKSLPIFGMSGERDGQTPKGALYVKTVTGEEEESGGLGKLSLLKNLLPLATGIITSPAFIAAAAIGGTALVARYMKQRNDEELKKPENANVPFNVQNAARNQNTAIATGGLTEGTADVIVQRLIEDKLVGAAADSLCNDIVRGSTLAKVLQVCSESMKQKYLDMVSANTSPEPTPAPAIPVPTPEPTATSVPDTTNDMRRSRGYIPPSEAGGGRGFINPELVRGSVPENAVLSGTGGTISTGSGGMAVSPSYGTTAPASMPRPTPAPSAPTPARPTSAPSTTPSAVSSAIGGSEAGGSYDIAFGDRINNKTKKIYNILKLPTAEEFSGGKKLSDMTLTEVQAFQAARDKINNGSSAVGKYQFMPNTLFGSPGKPGLVQELKLPMDTKFDANTQEQLQDLFLRGNKGILEKAGIKGTLGNLYMAHYVGPGGAIAVNKAAAAGKDMTVADAIIQAGYHDPSKNNPELSKIKVKDFEGVLEGRMVKNMPSQGTQIASASSELTAARYSVGRQNQTPAPVVVNAGGSGDTKILTTQRATPYDQRFYSGLVQNSAL